MNEFVKYKGVQISLSYLLAFYYGYMDEWLNVLHICIFGQHKMVSFKEMKRFNFPYFLMNRPAVLCAEWSSTETGLYEEPATIKLLLQNPK